MVFLASEPLGFRDSENHRTRLKRMILCSKTKSVTEVGHTTMKSRSCLTRRGEETPPSVGASSAVALTRRHQEPKQAYILLEASESNRMWFDIWHRSSFQLLTFECLNCTNHFLEGKQCFPPGRQFPRRTAGTSPPSRCWGPGCDLPNTRLWMSYSGPGFTASR